MCCFYPPVVVVQVRVASLIDEILPSGTPPPFLPQPTPQCSEDQMPSVTWGAFNWLPCYHRPHHFPLKLRIALHGFPCFSATGVAGRGVANHCEFSSM